MNVTDRALRYLDKLPPAIAGSGGHSAAFRAATALVHGFALPEAEALAVLRQWNTSHCQPPWSEAELRHKIRSALAKASEKPPGYLLGTDPQKVIHHGPPAPPPAPTWPARNADAIRRILAAGEGLADLLHRSPIDPEGHDAEELVDLLFPGNPWLCVAADQRDAITARREALRGRLGDLQFIVPSEMTGPTGATQEGRVSARSLENTGPRKFLVIEADFTAEDTEGQATPPDLCAGVIMHLAGFAPLVMAVSSGGKSVHGWFICEGRDETMLRRFMRYAVTLGADRATWTRCQFVRMPEGRRCNGRRQALLFLDASLLNR
jgi:hypothetical protein